MMRVDEMYVERVKMSADVTKHLITLSTGSVVVLASFLDKAFPKGSHYHPLIISAFALLMFSVLASIIVLLSCVYLMEPYVDGHPGTRKPLTHFATTIFILSFVFFWLGIASAGAFASLNLSASTAFNPGL